MGNPCFGIFHRIGWWENLQDSPIFDGKKPWFPVDFPLNQSNEYCYEWFQMWLYNYIHIYSLVSIPHDYLINISHMFFSPGIYPSYLRSLKMPRRDGRWPSRRWPICSNGLLKSLKPVETSGGELVNPGEMWCLIGQNYDPPPQLISSRLPFSLEVNDVFLSHFFSRFWCEPIAQAQDALERQRQREATLGEVSVVPSLQITGKKEWIDANRKPTDYYFGIVYTGMCLYV